MYKASDNLKAAKAAILDPKNWIKGRYEQDAEGKCNSDKPACQFCTIGAYHRSILTHLGVGLSDYSWQVDPEYLVEYRELSDDSSRYIQRAMKEMDLPRMGIASYNDLPETTHEDILALYDKAIEIAEREENNA